MKCMHHLWQSPAYWVKRTSLRLWDVTVLAPLIGLSPVYARFVESLSGAVTPVKGAATQGLTGMALLEQFNFAQ
jgi:hypothetical protein